MQKPIIVAAFAVLSVAACAANGKSAATTPQPPAAATVRLSDFALTPGELNVHQGDVILVENAGKAPHNLWVRNASGSVLAHTANLAPGEHARLKIDLPPGAYADYCQEPGHESLGMKGSLRVA